VQNVIKAINPMQYMILKKAFIILFSPIMKHYYINKILFRFQNCISLLPATGPKYKDYRKTLLGFYTKLILLKKRSLALP
jgi:hypothetical protein